MKPQTLETLRQAAAKYRKKQREHRSYQRQAGRSLVPYDPDHRAFHARAWAAIELSDRLLKWLERQPKE